MSKTIDVIDEEKDVKFKTSINYYDQSGKVQNTPWSEQTIKTEDYVNKVKDMVVAEMEFPVCQFGQTTDVTVTINGNANPKKKTETSIIYLDYIYLEPVIE